MKASSQDDQLEDWSMLLKTVRESERELKGAAPLLSALEGAQAQAVSLRSRRDALVTSAQKVTRQVNLAFATGQDAAISLRSYIRATLGPRCPDLARYGIAPLGKRRRGGRKVRAD